MVASVMVACSILIGPSSEYCLILFYALSSITEFDILFRYCRFSMAESGELNVVTLVSIYLAVYGKRKIKIKKILINLEKNLSRSKFNTFDVLCT